MMYKMYCVERYDAVYVVAPTEVGWLSLSISSLRLSAVVPVNAIMYMLQRLLHHAEE